MAGAASAAIAATAADPDVTITACSPASLAEWHIEALTKLIACDCDTPWCKSNGYGRDGMDARWLVGDRCTLARRYLCNECMVEFRRHPVRILNPYGSPYNVPPPPYRPFAYVRVTQQWVREALSLSLMRPDANFEIPRSWIRDFASDSWTVRADDPTLHALAFAAGHWDLLQPPFKHFRVASSFDPPTRYEPGQMISVDEAGWYDANPHLMRGVFGRSGA
jgi:hypothetical protein